MDLISIIVPVYNTEKYLKNCIDSLIRQTYQNIEIILIDDHSTDSSYDICEKYAQNDERIILLENTYKGVSHARNLGIENSNGKWIMFVDSDDWVEKDMVEKLYEVTTQSDSDIIMCGAFKDTINNVSTISFYNRGHYIFENKDKLILQRHAIVAMKGEYNPVLKCSVPWAKLYKKSFLINNNLKFSQKYIRGQDLIFNLYAFEKVNSIEYFDIPLYHYRANNDSVTNKSNIHTLDIFINILEGIESFIDSKQTNKDSIQEAYNIKILNLLDQYLFQLIYKDNLKFSIGQIKNKIIKYLETYEQNLKDIDTKYLFKAGKIKRFLLINHQITLYIILMELIIFIKYKKEINRYY